MFYLKLFSMFNEDDYEKEYLKKNKILKYFYKPKLKEYVAENTVEILMNHFLKHGQISNENDIISIKYEIEYDKEIKGPVLNGIVFVRGTFRGN